ncbi:WAT1-related protein At1g25270-like [Durio zibethinus]|uniref:WAT1-related protein n=1 Tax=Durio zibethinus TaxID=66656 RepID=A0A6P5ZIH9_DURZI|nr:WAT1-related protein At1g25270-like [Durio zibethinus]
MLTQVIGAGVNILYKVSYNVGFSLRILVVYQFIVATICILPFALIVDRGALGQNIFAASFAFASVTYLAAISNLSLAVTYMLAIVFRMETFTLATWPGKFKLIGTVISITGAMIISFYSGPNIHLWSTSVDLLQHHGIAALTQVQRPVYGIMLAFSSCVCFAIFLTILTMMSRTYSYPVFSSLLFMCSSSTVLSTIYAISIERDWSAWYLAQDASAITYSGILASGLSVMLATWCARQQGPVFVFATSPLALIFTALMGPTLLHEEIHLGSVIGGLLIIIGTYATLWGKSAETQSRRDDLAIQIVQVQSRRDDPDIESVETQLRRDHPDLERVEIQLSEEDLDLEGAK